MSEEFSDIKQRAAVCYSQFDKRKTESSIMKKDLLLKTLNKAEKEFEKNQAQTIPGNPPNPIDSIYMVCDLPDSLSFNAKVGESFSFPVYVAFRNMGEGYPYFPYVNIKSSVYVSPKDVQNPEDSDCGESNPHVRRISPCTFESALVEENFPNNGAGWRVHKRDVNFELGPDCVPYGSFRYFSLAWKMEAIVGSNPEIPENILSTRIVLLQKDAPGQMVGIGEGRPAVAFQHWELLPSCPNTSDDPRIGIEPMRPTRRPADPLSPGRESGIGSSNFDRLGEILKKKLNSNAGAFPNYPEVGEESEALSNCKSKTVYAAMSSIERECAKEIHRGKRRACIGKFAKQVCSKHNDCALVHGETNQMIDCSEYAANSIRLLKDEIAPKLKSVATLTPIDFDHKLMIGSQSFMVKVSDTEVTRKRGLMYTNKLKEGNGMLFTFDEEADHTMWMKNVNIPLDMIFIDKDKKVVKVQTVQPCESKPCELYKAGQPIMHVLELNPGEFTGNVGDTISIEKIEREYNTDFTRRGLS